MDLQQKLKEQGWHITSEGLEKLLSDVDKCDNRKVVQSLLNIDLRDVGAGALPVEISRKEDSIAGRVVLQVVKVRNISAPKSNEESKTAPRFLYLELTDGVTQIFALELEHISSISLNTPPGTKLYLRSESIPLMQGTLVLRPSDVQVLGGEVTALVEKWELSRTLQKYARGGRVNTGTSGPPPWIPFGQKIQQFNDDKNFKSLAAAGNGPEKEKDGKENEFDAMRNEAIAEAAKSGAKKVFGGGHQQMLDHNVKKIIEKGFSELEAKNALKTTRNNLERALYNLKRRDEGRERPDNKDLVRVANKRGPFKEVKKGSAKEDQPVTSAKPAGNVSLFDFLTDKLPANTETSSAMTTTAGTTNTTSSANRYEKSSSRYESSKSYGTSSSQPQSYTSGYQSQSSIPNNQQTSTTSSSSQQQQSNRSAKFENNISSSFANRNTTSNPMESGEGNSYRNRPRNERGGSRGGYSAPYSSRQSADVGRGGGSSHGYNSSNRNPARASQERDRGANHQQTDVSAPENQLEGQKGGSEYKSFRTERSSSARYPNKPNYTNNASQNNANINRNHAENRNSTHSDSEKIKELIDETAKMQIEHKPSMRGGGASGRGQRSHSHYQQHNHQKESQQNQNNIQQQHVQIGTQPQMLHPQQQPQPHAVYTPLPNGFAYDPNKIIGFQNKESNEYALSLLKTQTIPPTGATIPAPPQNAHPPYPQPPPPMQMPPPQAFHPGPPPFIMQPPHVRAFGIPAIDGSVFNWSIGDRCLAKYWDDGRYYEADITGLSDKTCVVLFLGYGNYEEVLKSDCLPINNNPTIIAHPATSVAPQSMQPTLHPVLAQPNLRTATGAPSSGRYRGERQMYVPPPKREA